MTQRTYNPEQDDIESEADYWRRWLAQDAAKRAARRAKHPPHTPALRAGARVTDRMLFAAGGTLWLTLICWVVFLWARG